MLSILIPTYNYDCSQLVKELHRQAEALQVPFEIIVADDASHEEMKINNRTINLLMNCNYLELKANIGRARIRNWLARQARYPILLFMDSDAGVCKSNFLNAYLNALSGNEVICGGLCYPDQLPSASVSLRYYYGIVAEARSAETRSQRPYSQFTTFSFLMRRDTFLSIGFSEQFTQYGHEDTDFGIQLQKQNILVKHIDNPLYHLGMEKNEVFLQKTKTGIQMLLQKQEQLRSHVRLLNLYNKVKSLRLRIFFSFLFWVLEPTWRKNLLGIHPSMKIFALYKLSYMCYLGNKV